MNPGKLVNEMKKFKCENVKKSTYSLHVEK